MTDLNEQLQEVIRENLPAQMGDEMRKYLKQAKYDKQSLEGTKEELGLRTRERDVAIGQRDELQVNLDKHQKLDEREAKITEREIRADVTAAEHRAIAAERRAEGIHDLVGTIFRNPTVRKTITDTKKQDYPADYSKSHTDTETHAEETVEE